MAFTKAYFYFAHSLIVVFDTQIYFIRVCKKFTSISSVID